MEEDGGRKEREGVSRWQGKEEKRKRAKLRDGENEKMYKEEGEFEVEEGGSSGRRRWKEGKWSG